MHILNEESDYTTFRSRRGTSNIDITVISNQLTLFWSGRSANRKAAPTTSYDRLYVKVQITGQQLTAKN